MTKPLRAGYPKPIFRFSSASWNITGITAIAGQAARTDKGSAPSEPTLILTPWTERHASNLKHENIGDVKGASTNGAGGR